MNLIAAGAVVTLAVVGLAFAYRKKERRDSPTTYPESVADTPSDTQPPAPAAAAATLPSGAADVLAVSTPPGQFRGTRAHFLTPTASLPEVIQSLLSAGWYTWGDKTPGRIGLRPGDRLCIYETTNGVVAEAEVAGAPELGIVDGVGYDHAGLPWRFRVRNVRCFFDRPVLIDSGLRSQLDWFDRADPGPTWGFFVQATRSVTPHDFAILSGSSLLDR